MSCSPWQRHGPGWWSILLGTVDEAGLDLVVDGGGSVQLAALGMTLEAARVSRQASASIAVLLDEAAALVESVDEPPPSIEASTVAEDEQRRASAPLETPLDDLASMCAGGDVDFDAAGALLDVNTAADCRRVGTDRTLSCSCGCSASQPWRTSADLGGKERMVLVYVASTGGEADKSSVIDAVWGGARISDQRLLNVLARHPRQARRRRLSSTIRRFTEDPHRRRDDRPRGVRDARRRVPLSSPPARPSTCSVKPST